MIFSKKIDDEVSRLRGRLVDGDRILKENEEMNKWHQRNSELEREYLSRHKKY